MGYNTYLKYRQSGLCGTCGEAKTGLRARCDACNKRLGSYRRNTPAQRKNHARYMRKYYRDHSEMWRENGLKRKYGLTLAEYNRLLANQNGHCAICPATIGEEKRMRKLFVDHDHTTGKVRGLLCSRCNSAVGHLRDHPKYAHALVGYLMRWL